MNKIALHRIVALGGFLCALVTLAWNLFGGRELLYSAFVSLCVMFLVSSVLNFGLHSICQILINYLQEQKDRIQSENDQSQFENQNQTPNESTQLQ